MYKLVNMYIGQGQSLLLGFRLFLHICGMYNYHGKSAFGRSFLLVNCNILLKRFTLLYQSVR